MFQLEGTARGAKKQPSSHLHKHESQDGWAHTSSLDLSILSEPLQNGQYV